MNEILKLYSISGCFYFAVDTNLKDVCTAPKRHGGIYCVYNYKRTTKKLIYIGSSGWISQCGDFKIRRNGMFQRIVNGKQFKKKRKESWSIKMKEQNIKKIRVDWYQTFDESIEHIPAYVEALCIQKYFEENKCLPIWNTEF
jgi:hypothetical protein